MRLKACGQEAKRDVTHVLLASPFLCHSTRGFPPMGCGCGQPCRRVDVTPDLQRNG